MKTSHHLYTGRRFFGAELPRNGRLTRRQFLRRSTGVSLGLALGAYASAKPHRQHLKHVSQPNHSGIDHIIVVMMENRSFDHFLGWLPGADGRQTGLVYRDHNGMPHMTAPLAPDYQGCGHPDPDHSYAGGRVEYDNGACDGWLRAGNNDDYAIGYYTQNDLSFLGKAAPAWTVCDRYFAPIMAGT